MVEAKKKKNPGLYTPFLVNDFPSLPFSVPPSHKMKTCKLILTVCKLQIPKNTQF